MFKLDDATDSKVTLDKIEIEGLVDEISEIEIEEIVNSIKDQVKGDNAEVKIEVRIEKDSES
jgi:hypothetical protein